MLKFYGSLSEENKKAIQIYFKWPKKSCKFLCQKNLLVEEKIESFENLFKNKIEHK